MDFEIRQIEQDPAAMRVAPYLMKLANQAADETAFLSQAIPLITEAAEAGLVALARGSRGRWQILESFGRARVAREPELPLELCADALDRVALVHGDRGWAAAPTVREGAGEEVLVAHLDGPPAERLEPLAALLGHSLRVLRRRIGCERRVTRLETILRIAAQWRHTRELSTLLERMAEASTKLLDAERASIFLWDRPNKTLVGRPAMGVENGELRIPDDKGIVGQVVQTGQVRRVDEDPREQREIDRTVDQKLNFQTRSLLCAPLRGENGELFGAFEMINKRNGNFTDEDEAALCELAEHAAIALENTQQYEQLAKSRSQMAEQAAEGVRLIGDCSAIEALRSTVRRVAGTELAVLILGENGTGKEVVAQMVHYLSPRRDEPFVAINCAALTESLLESELFGHEKGAFTDARESRAGKFELAGEGTLFLDEIGDMSLGGQAKLLRVLEEKVVVRVGGSTPIHTNARVIAATNQDLAEMVREKRFREDLFYRLNVVALELPPLRQREHDVIVLAEHFLREFSIQAHRRPPILTPAARKKMLQHPWPGNVRELRNLMERIAYLSADDEVDVDDLSFILAPDDESTATIPHDLTLKDATREFQVEYIRRKIEQSRNNMTEAAESLGLHRSNLYRKMRQLGMPTNE